MTRWVARALAGGVAFWLGAFLQFIADLPPALKGAAGPKADAIVALTGGRNRLDTGLMMLNRGAAPRLLVSGVDPALSAEDLRARLGASRAQFACCIAFDRAADTYENAAETAAWAAREGVASIALVTARYHMPRARLLFARVDPSLEVRPAPVDSDLVDIDRWWRAPNALRVLGIEHVKFTLAVLGARP